MNAAELRNAIKTNPELIDAALEVEERAVDTMRQAILEGMSDEDPIRRLRAASAWLRMTEPGRKRLGLK